MSVSKKMMLLSAFAVTSALAMDTIPESEEESDTSSEDNSFQAAAAGQDRKDKFVEAQAASAANDVAATDPWAMYRGTGAKRPLAGAGAGAGHRHRGGRGRAKRPLAGAGHRHRGGRGGGGGRSRPPVAPAPPPRAGEAAPEGGYGIPDVETLKVEIQKLATPNEDWAEYEDWVKTKSIESWKSATWKISLSKVNAFVAALDPTSDEFASLQQECASYIWEREYASLDSHFSIQATLAGEAWVSVQTALAGHVIQRLTMLTKTLKARAAISPDTSLETPIFRFLSGVADNLQKQVLKREIMKLATPQRPYTAKDKKAGLSPEKLLANPLYSVEIAKAILASLAQDSIATRPHRRAFQAECASYIRENVHRGFFSRMTSWLTWQPDLTTMRTFLNEYADDRNTNVEEQQQYVRDQAQFAELQLERGVYDFLSFVAAHLHNTTRREAPVKKRTAPPQAGEAGDTAAEVAKAVSNAAFNVATGQDAMDALAGGQDAMAALVAGW